MGTLIDALVARVNLVRAPVEAIRADESGWSVFSDGEWRSFDVVLACGANRAAAAGRLQSTAMLANCWLDPVHGSSIWTFGYRRETCRIRSTRLAFWFRSRSGARSWRARGSRPSGWGACLPIRPSSAAFRPTRTSRARHRKPNCGV
jgi:hypothetical protein